MGRLSQARIRYTASLWSLRGFNIAGKLAFNLALKLVKERHELFFCSYLLRERDRHLDGAIAQFHVLVALFYLFPKLLFFFSLHVWDLTVYYLDQEL